MTFGRPVEPPEVIAFQ
jgi:hypothetical protein